LEVWFIWQRFACRKASRLKMHCAGLSARFNRKTLLRK